MSKSKTFEFAVYVLIGMFVILVVSFLFTSTSGNADNINDGDTYVFSDSADENAKLVEEDFYGDNKRHVRIKNLGVSTVYVKITPYIKCVDQNGELCDHIVRDDAIMDINYEYWAKRGISYYYKHPLKPGKYTQFFIENCAEADDRGNKITIDFEIEALEYDGVSTKREG